MVEQKYLVGIAVDSHSFSVRFPKSTAKSNKSDVICQYLIFGRGLYKTTYFVSKGISRSPWKKIYLMKLTIIIC